MIDRLKQLGRVRLAIVVAGVLVGLSAVTAFTVSLTNTLQSIDRHEASLVTLQQQANDGLAKLEPKVAHLKQIREKAATVSATLGGVETDLAATDEQVGALDKALAHIARRLVGVSTGIVGLDARVGGISAKLGGLSRSLSSTAGNVATLAEDTDQIASQLSGFPAGLVHVNKRLGYVNSVVGSLGRGGVTSEIGLTIYVNKERLGAATITAVLIPTGAWR